MSLSREQILAVALRLDEAERTRTQIRAVSVEHPGAGIADAYAIQAAWIDRKLKAGRRISGLKIGLTSRAMQAAVGIGEPDSGVLLDDMVFPDGGVVPVSRFIGLRVEAELAFVLRTPLSGPDCTLFDVLDAAAYVVPALEILDTRIFRVDPATGAPRTVVDTIADNAANAGIVVGGRPFRPLDHDLRWIGAICARNGAVEETGLAAGVLNHPAAGIAWLANRLAPLGQRIEPGQVVLSGSFIRPIEVSRGDTVQADYGPFGTVSCHFA
ncbi:2-oxo-hept-4-ene-1,7-dioate hydratase [Methylobacterium crusticola]|uniref:2-oxo-hept-4-ene-1,7-dioate hydratase n=1 Tax=Methylobacterium crusticola TaxID=1697972 RepID=UPI000FFB220E|nr:2-oxo-hepta-3-ene-1,7-dioic acid hydratase [Methylobacterium crusticola]